MHMMSMSVMMLSDEEERDVDVRANLRVVGVGENAEDPCERRTVMRAGRNDFMMN
jgi:hypothetical protein